MELTERVLFTVLHGLILGTLFLLAFAGGLAGLYSLRERLLTSEGVQERMPRLLIGTWVMAIVAWLTVLTGTFIAYPWYRAKPPAGIDLKDPAKAAKQLALGTRVITRFANERKGSVLDFWFEVGSAAGMSGAKDETVVGYE